MALQEVATAFLRRLRISPEATRSNLAIHVRRYATDQTSDAAQAEELESSSEFMHKQTPTKRSPSFDPALRRQRRNRELPRSRYQPRPPRYYRGPLHPIQPPKPSDPSSREFIAGPFSLPRLEQTYHDTLAADFMTMTYTHFPPGYTHHKKPDRLRPWVGDSPYFKNRPARGPRGHAALQLLEKPITFRNIPKITGITVHSMVSEAIEGGSGPLHVAGMVLQNITNVRAEPHKTKHAFAPFRIRAGQALALTCELQGEDAYHFLSKIIDVVLPKVKDFQGAKGSSGDGNGTIAFGLTPEQVALFPEVEVNYDAYPPKLIPGCHIFIKTSSPSDEEARLLLMQMGLPFYGRTKRSAFVEAGQWKPSRQEKGYYAIAQDRES